MATKNTALKKNGRRIDSTTSLARDQTPRAKNTPLAKKNAAHLVPLGTLSTFLCDDSMHLIKRTREGLPAKIVATLAEELGLKKTGLYATLGLARSTMEERISQNAPLSLTEGDRIFRAFRVFARAIEVFEDVDSARRWINQEIRSLGGVSPLSLLDTEPGYELVLQTLGRIEQGVVA